MNSEQRRHLNPQHQQETVSTASLQAFEDPEGGLSLDSLVVKAREQERRARSTSLRPAQAVADGKSS